MSKSNTIHNECYLCYVNNSPIPGMENSSIASTMPMITMDNNENEGEGTDFGLGDNSVTKLTMDMDMCTIRDTALLDRDRSIDQCQFREKCEDLSKLEMYQQWECSLKISGQIHASASPSPEPEEKEKLENIPNSYPSSSSAFLKWTKSNSSLICALQNSSPQQKNAMLNSPGLRVNCKKPSWNHNQNQRGLDCLHRFKHSPRKLNSQARLRYRSRPVHAIRGRSSVSFNYGPAIYWNGPGPGSGTGTGHHHRHRQNHENITSVGFKTVGQLSEADGEMDFRTK